MKVLVALSVVLAIICQQVASETLVSVWEHHSFKGARVDLEDLEKYSYIYFTVFDDHVTSFKINTGSCVEMHMNTPPGYDSDDDWFWTSTLDYPNVGERYNDRISSVKSCGKETKTINCPEGQFVKKMSWDDSNMMTNGVELHCYRPKSLSVDSVVRTHGSGDLATNAECTGIRGVKYGRDERRQADVGMSPVCRDEEANDNTIICGEGQAVTGMQVDVENRSGFIKSSTLFCSDVGDIESICAAHDKKSVLFTCDASVALYPLKCSHAKTVGYGYKSSSSEEEKNERVFYEEFNFDLGAAGYGLSANFKYNLSTSEITGYSWETTQESTFHEEVTVTVEAEAPAGCITQVVEIIGECSFIQVRPYYFQRLDNCDNASFVTDIHIPADFDKSQVFVSKIPENVAQYMKTVKGKE